MITFACVINYNKRIVCSEHWVKSCRQKLEFAL